MTDVLANYLESLIMNDNHKDYLTAIAIGLLLCIGLMAWFDILVK